MDIKKFIFQVWHKIGFIFSLPVLYTKMKSSKRKFNDYESNPESLTLEERYSYVYSAVSHAIFCSNTKITIKGQKNIPNKPVLFVANHKANLDVLVVLKAFSKLTREMDILNTTFVSKKELQEKVDVYYAAKLINTIFLDRKNLRDALRVIKEEKEMLLKGEQSIMVFIEGTRVKQDSLGEFKSAVLEPAYSTYCSIVPVVIHGTLNADIKKTKYKDVTIEFLPPLKYKEFINYNKETVALKIKEKMEKKYLEIKESKTKKKK